MFKLEVTADSIPELADRLLALGAQLSIPPETGLQRTVASIVAATETEQPQRRTRGPNKPKAEPEVDAAQQNAAEQPEPQTESMAGKVEAAAETQAEAEVESGIVAADLDFDKDVAPRVLDLVARKGREAMTNILDQFGAARASEVDAAQWPELVAKLEEAVA